MNRAPFQDTGNPLTAHHLSTILPSPAPAKTCLGLKEVWCDFAALNTTCWRNDFDLIGRWEEKTESSGVIKHGLLEKSLFYSKVHPMRSHEYSMISPLPSSNMAVWKLHYSVRWFCYWNPNFQWKTPSLPRLMKPEGTTLLLVRSFHHDDRTTDRRRILSQVISRILHDKNQA